MPFKIYRSSAGSGKTFTLVKEYLRLSLATSKPDSYPSILAITLTNKAAEEMKSRVIAVLKALSDSSTQKHDMGKILIEELGLSDEELTLRARQTLKHMLHHYSDISISTIDHFTHGLIRSFAQDLELSVNFEVELDSDRISNEIVNNILSNVGEDTVLTKALLNVLDQQLEGERTWSIRQTLVKFSKGLFSEESRFHLDKLQNIDLEEFNRIQTSVKSRVIGLENRMIESAQTALKEYDRVGVAPASTFYANSGGPYSYFKKIASKNFEPPGKRVNTSIEEDKWTSGKATKEDKDALELIKPSLIQSIQTIADNYPTWNYLKVISDNLYSAALLDEMLRVQHEIQKENEMLHIGQFNHLVSEVVMKETAPFIYERIGNRYRHFLVDEFQDTSVLQWFNLLPLVDESLSQGNLCLVVGDAKQSIYRWRGGDVNQFVKLPDIYRTKYLNEKLAAEPEVNRLMLEREAAMNNQKKVETLGSNYRSASKVVNFNNQLFNSLKDGMDEHIRSIYQKSEQKVEKDAPGLVNIKFFEKTVSDNKTCPHYAQRTLEQIDLWIQECLSDGFIEGDIAIILRSNKDAVAVAQFLVEEGHKVVSNESLLINSSPAVRTVVNLATWLSFPDNHVNMVELIQNLGLVREESELTADRLNQLRDNPHSEIQKLLSELFPDAEWSSIKQFSLFGLFEQLLFVLNSSSEDVYTNFFLDEVLSYSKTHSDGVLGFLEFWNEKRHDLSISLQENNDAIRIMTIHKSKGLEFPVVIHPFADYPTKTRGNDVWAYLEDESLKPLDRLRIRTSSKLEKTPFESYQDNEKSLSKMDMYNELYVAYTRPKYRLYSSGWISSKRTVSTAVQHVHHHLASTDQIGQDELHFQVGSRETQTPENVKTTGFALSYHGNPNWNERISISRPSKDRWKTANESDARNLGILIHEAMAHIKTKQDVEKAVSVLIEDGRISKNESQELKSKIEDLFNRDELSDLYNSKNTIRNEAAIQLESGKWLRPDRIAFNEERAWVLDYKTGKKESKHMKQIEHYKDALVQLGFKHVEGVLVYVNDGDVVTV